MEALAPTKTSSKCQVWKGQDGWERDRKGCAAVRDGSGMGKQHRWLGKKEEGEGRESGKVGGVVDIIMG